MRISWLSNAPFVNVGYGTLMRNILPPIHKKHESCLITNFGIESCQRIDNCWNGITFYGKGFGDFNEDIVPAHIKDFNSDVLITVYDAWAFHSLPQLLNQHRMTWVPYVPVDADRLNPIYRDFLKYAFKIIPMSQHSERCIKEYFPEKTLPAIGVGVNTNIFKPTWETIEEKNKLKTNFGFKEDEFVISIMGDIKAYRLSWAENLEGIKHFIDNNPDVKIKVHIHTMVRPLKNMDFSIKDLIHEMKLENYCRMTEPYIYLKGLSDTEMAKAYNMSDVFLQGNRGHGFGAMMVESASTGCPSIATDFTSGDEVIVNGKTGHLVKPAMVNYDQSIAKKAIPDPYDIADKLQLVLKNGSTSYKKECVAHAQKYDWDKVIIPKWLDTLDKLEIDIKESGVKIPTDYSNIQDKYKIKIIH